MTSKDTNVKNLWIERNFHGSDKYCKIKKQTFIEGYYIGRSHRCGTSIRGRPLWSPWHLLRKRKVSQPVPPPQLSIVSSALETATQREVRIPPFLSRRYFKSVPRFAPTIAKSHKQANLSEKFQHRPNQWAFRALGVRGISLSVLSLPDGPALVSMRVSFWRK